MTHVILMKRYILKTGNILTGCLCWVLLGAVANGQVSATGDSAGKRRTLSVGDTVQVTVYQDPMLNTSQQVSTDGTIEMFYIGPVQVKGITTQAAAAKIAERLLDDKYIRNAQVRVSVDGYVSEVVTVKGEVNRPGPVTLLTDRPMDLLEAIASAGGETRAGDLSHVEVRRTQGAQSSTQKINLKALAKQNQVFIVEPGDVITVGIRMF
jgi:protein involved in polysaccharide export with SLBB domain